MYLYALRCSRVSFGVLRVHRCKYSLAIAFNFCTLKFCNNARKDQQDGHHVRCARYAISGACRKIRTRIQAQQCIRNLRNMPPIRGRSAKGSAHDRTGPVSAASRNQYKSFSIFQPKFHENFVKFVKNAVLVFWPV